MTIAYIGLGSNIGDRVGHIQQALHFLQDHPDIRVLTTSSLYETEPVGYKDQEWFINAAVAIETDLLPKELLKVCQDIEHRLHRVRDPNNRDGPRTIDLDILFYDDMAIDTPELTIPHPRVQERAYALVPMLEVNARVVHPRLMKNVEQLHHALAHPEEVFLYGTRSQY